MNILTAPDVYESEQQQNWHKMPALPDIANSTSVPRCSGVRNNLAIQIQELVLNWCQEIIDRHSTCRCMCILVVWRV